MLLRLMQPNINVVEILHLFDRDFKKLIVIEEKSRKYISKALQIENI